MGTERFRGALLSAFVIALLMVSVISLLCINTVSAQEGAAQHDSNYIDGVYIGGDVVTPLAIGDVIYAVPSPETNYSHGLAWDGTALWVSGAFTGMIYRFDPFTNTVLRSFHGPTNQLRDLAWDGTNLWVTSWDWPRAIYKLNPENGSVITSFPAPFSGHPDGLAWDGNYLWIGEQDGRVYKVDPSTGLAVYSFPVPYAENYNPKGLAWDGENIWAGYQLVGLIKKHDIATGDVLTSFSSPSGPFQQGLAWDGQYLWSTGGNNYIYQIENLPPPIPIGRWDAFITATFSGGSDDAIFGVRPDATDNFDNVYDIPEPPALPEPPYVRAYFYYPEQTPDELHRSYLSPENLMEWPLRVEYADNIENVTLTWSVENIPTEYNVILYREESLVADMRADESYTFEASTGSYDFRIVVGELLPFTLELAQGWNMISFPVLPENSSPDAIFDGYYVLYRWDAEDKHYMPHADSGSFIEPDPDVEPGVGYWAYVLEDENVDLLGVPVYQLNLSLRQGWNLIGSTYGGSSIADLADDPDDSVLPHAFTWNAREKSYIMTQLLEAGKGYWVYAMQPPQPGYPAISATSAKVGDNEIRINAITGSIPALEWAYSISVIEGSYDWTAGTEELDAPYVSLGTYAAGTYYVSLKHIDSGHFYFWDQPITIS